VASSARDFEKMRAALRSPGARGPHGYVELDLAGRTLTLEGEVASPAVRTLLLRRAAAQPAVERIIDRLRVVPVRRMEDAPLRRAVREALLAEPVLAAIALRERCADQMHSVRELANRSGGEIRLGVHDGVITLDGIVPGLMHKRLVGVLAWWVPGRRDVINRIAVADSAANDAEEIAAAVEMVLDKDPLLHASRIRVTARDAAVVLEGTACSEAERERAESDAWYVFGVCAVENRLAVTREDVARRR
jgi:osmotically-inducible protein OsmY